MKPHLSSNPLCSQVANLLLRHKAQPLADKTWRIYLAEAVDAGIVETGTEGIGREWVKVAVSFDRRYTRLRRVQESSSLVGITI